MFTSNLDQDPSATVALTAVIGAPYRRLQQGEWHRLNRPTTIGAHCDIGPFCVVGAEAMIGECTVLDSFTLIGWGATIGKNVIATHRASVGAKARIGDDCVIGGLICERSVVGNGSRVFGDLIHRQLDPTLPWDAPEAMENSPILEDGAFIGWGATVVGDIKIGKGAYVCAGATVTRDVDPGKIVKGTNEIISPDEWPGKLGEKRASVRCGPTI
jgi:acetyltransferase-like isoleucine patch superfamily enzyme